MIAYFVLWQVYSVLHAGDAAPLDYIPVLNPLELTGILCLAAMTTWGSAQSQAGHEFSAHTIVRLIAELGFVRRTISRMCRMPSIHYGTRPPYNRHCRSPGPCSAVG